MTVESENIETARRYLRAIEEGVDFDELAIFFTLDVVQHEFPNQLVPKGAEHGAQEIRGGGRAGTPGGSIAAL